jgi:hypothetical protein
MTDHANVGSHYNRVLSVFPPRRVGWGRDPRFPGYASQPMTYALVALAESRFPENEGAERGRRSIQWLIRNADLDGDGRRGWGLPHEYDAFNDGVGAAGATNPRHHPYTVTTALVLEALAAAITADWLSTGELRTVVEICHDVCRRWTREVVSREAVGAYFWYSPHVSDAIDCPNVSAMMAGAIRELRALDVVPDPDSEIDDIVDEVVRHLVASVQRNVAHDPAWPYINDGRSMRANDAVHHAYTIWGLERYRGNDGLVRLPWTAAKSAASCRAFFRNGIFTELPRRKHEPPGRTARLWGAGMLLAVVARYGKIDEAVAMAAAIRDTYASSTGLRLLPDDHSGSVYPRHVAHVLLGLAELARRTMAEPKPHR